MRTFQESVTAAMIYETLLLTGSLGLITLTALGFGKGTGHSDGHGANGHSSHGHSPHGHSSHGHSVDAHGHGHHGTVHAPPTAHANSQTHAPNATGDPEFGHLSASLARGVGKSIKAPTGKSSPAGKAGKAGSVLLEFLSPMTLFGVCLGAGATGLLLQPALGSTALTGLGAAGGGLLFHFGLARPVTGFILSFASKPARTLAGSVAQEAQVISRFDEQGRGMIRLNVDGQVVTLLAYLDRDDHKNGVTVASGDRVVVTDVDTRKNTVQVTRL